MTGATANQVCFRVAEWLDSWMKANSSEGHWVIRCVQQGAVGARTAVGRGLRQGPRQQE
jgi:hypothetical protein